MPHSPSLHARSGFTLIELLVVISIMSILVGVGIVNFLSFNERQRLITTAREIQLFIRQAQSKAQTKPIASVVCPGGMEVQGFAVNTVSIMGTTTLQILPRCGTSIAALQNATSGAVGGSLTLPTGISLSAALQVEFYTHGRGGHVTSPASGTVILSGSSQTYSFALSPEGGVSEGELSEPGTNDK